MMQRSTSMQLTVLLAATALFCGAQAAQPPTGAPPLSLRRCCLPVASLCLFSLDLRGSLQHPDMASSG